MLRNGGSEHLPLVSWKESPRLLSSPDKENEKQGDTRMFTADSGKGRGAVARGCSRLVALGGLLQPEMGPRHV